MWADSILKRFFLILPLIWSKNQQKWQYCVQKVDNHSFFSSFFLFTNQIYIVNQKKMNNIAIVPLASKKKWSFFKRKSKKKTMWNLSPKRKWDLLIILDARCLQAHFIFLTISLKSIWWNEIVIWHIEKD